MGVIDLSAYKPVPSTLGDANQIANGFQALQNLLNGSIDNNNFAAGKIFDPTKIMQNAAAVGQALVWDGANWSPASVGGWAALSALTYGTTDGHTFTATYAGDLTGSVPVGARIKLTNQAATQYFIVTAHVAGTLTLYGGTTYSITNTAITNPFYSREKAPVGFPLDPNVWTETVTDTGTRTQATPTSGTWYNPGAVSIAIPIGAWSVEYWGILYHQITNTSAYVTLSTANNTESDVDFTAYGAINAATLEYLEMSKRKSLLLAAKTSYFMNVMTDVGGSTSVGIRGDIRKTIIRAVCAYL